MRTSPGEFSFHSKSPLRSARLFHLCLGGVPMLVSRSSPANPSGAAKICFIPGQIMLYFTTTTPNIRGEPMRNVARLKMGYYPLPESEGVKLRALLSFPQPASAVDPCVG